MFLHLFAQFRGYDAEHCFKGEVAVFTIIIGCIRHGGQLGFVQCFQRNKHLAVSLGDSAVLLYTMGERCLQPLNRCLMRCNGTFVFEQHYYGFGNDIFRIELVWKNLFTRLIIME